MKLKIIFRDSERAAIRPGTPCRAFPDFNVRGHRKGRIDGKQER